MFRIFTIFACVLAIANAHFLDGVDSLRIFGAGIFLLSGMAAFSSGSMRHRSVLDVMFIWAMWIIISDWGSYFPPLLAAIETEIFVVLIACVYFKSYKHRSDEIDPDSGNMYIAFYGGPNAPFLSRIGSHFGFPFPSIAVAGNGVGMRPSKLAGAMVRTTPNALRKKGYIFIDTGIKATPGRFGKMMMIEGTTTRYGIFRVKCLSNLRPVLESLGDEWTPDGWPFPGWYYKKCLGNVA